MTTSTATPRLATAASLLAASFGALAQSGETFNTLKLGYARVMFHSESGDLTGPPGTTPAGIRASVKNADTLALVYERKVSGPWSVVFQVGVPPTLELHGAGTAAALGEVGRAKANMPALLVNYSFDGFPAVRPYAAAGVNYTVFTNRQVSDSYTTALGGTGSKATLKDSFGPVLKLGLDFPVAPNWAVDLALSHYWIKTRATVVTATPGLGDVARKVSLKANPDVFSLVVAYKF